MSPLSKEVTTQEAVNNRHPLAEFKGKLVDITDKTEISKRTRKPYTILTFDFVDIEVIKANEPYNFPTTSVDIMEMNVPFSQWEAWKKSVRDCGYTGGIEGLINKHMHWEFGSALLSQRVQEVNDEGVLVDVEPARYENRAGYCWLVREISGVENTGGQLLDWILDNINEHTEAQFKASFMAEAELRSLTGYNEAMVQIMAGTYLPPLVSSGVLSVDSDGVYHKVNNG